MLNLARELFTKPYAPEKVHAVMTFLKHCIRLPMEKEHIFASEVDKIINYQSTMGIVEMVIEREKIEARKEGLKEGREEAIAKLIQKKLQKGDSVATISEALEMSQAQIKKLIKEFKLA